MTEINRILSIARHAVDDATRVLARACAVGTRIGASGGAPGLDPVLLDQRQVETYSLAFAAAQLGAAEAMQRYADDSGDQLMQELAQFHCEDVLPEVINDCAAITAEAGGESHRTSTVVRTVQSARVSHLAQEIAKRGARFAPDLVAEDKRLMRATFRQFADAVVAPQAQDIHRRDLTVPGPLIKALANLGCFGLCVPESYGGVKPDDRDDSLGMLIATEELSRASLGAAGSLITRPEILARALLEGGTAAQKRQWLPRLASGEAFCAVSVTEPNVGSDVASVALRATRVEGGWLLNGAKTWCTLAGLASVIMVIARTDQQARPPHRGLSLFLVEKPPTEDQAFEHHDGRGGRVSGRAIPTLGYRGMHSFEMVYEDFFVPNSHLIGEQDGEGRGFYFTMRGFTGGRLQTAGRAVGVMQAAFEAALNYASQRNVFAKPIAAFPLTQQKLVRMAARLLACRQLSYRVAEMMDGEGGQMEASLVKLLACRNAEWVTREAQQIHGGMGYAEETPVSRLFVDARVLSIFEGAEETLALKVIGRELLERGLKGDNRG